MTRSIAGTLSLNSSNALTSGGDVTIAADSLDIHGQSPHIGNHLCRRLLGHGGQRHGQWGNQGRMERGDITYVGTLNRGVTYFPAATVSANVQLAVTLGGDAQISLFDRFTPAVGNIFYVLLNDGNDAVNATFFNDQNKRITSGGWEYQDNYAANGDGGAASNDVSLTVLVAVPEPATWAMLAGGFGLLLGFQRLRRRRVRNCKYPSRP